jgi:hypothetical protein
MTDSDNAFTQGTARTGSLLQCLQSLQISAYGLVVPMTTSLGNLYNVEMEDLRKKVSAATDDAPSFGAWKLRAPVSLGTSYRPPLLQVSVKKNT